MHVADYDEELMMMYLEGEDIKEEVVVTCCAYSNLSVKFFPVVVALPLKIKELNLS
jgi:translation elongation factor EF-G